MRVRSLLVEGDPLGGFRNTGAPLPLMTRLEIVRNVPEGAQHRCPPFVAVSWVRKRVSGRAGSLSCQATERG